MGGTNYDYGNSVQQTSDGGYIVAGSTYSSNGDVAGLRGGEDFWIIKLNASGAIDWQRCLGGSGDDEADAVQQTSDGGYIVAGSTNSNNGDVSGKHRNSDCWVVKLSSAGSIQWQNAIGGDSSDVAYFIQQTTDGGYIVAGLSGSNDSYVFGNYGDVDLYIVKINANGGVQWQSLLGGTGSYRASFIKQTVDGGYIISGSTQSNNGNVSGNHGNDDCWIVKLGAGGGLQWQRCLGGTGTDQADGIQQYLDGGYIFSGVTTSNNGDVFGNHTPGFGDAWIVKLNQSGGTEWQTCLGGSRADRAFSIVQTSNGEYVIGEVANSIDGDINNNHGSQDGWIVKLNSSGGIRWQTCLGGSNLDDLPAEKTFLHRNEFEKLYTQSGPLPAIFYLNETVPVELMNASEIDACESLEQLQEAILNKMKIHSHD